MEQKRDDGREDICVVDGCNEKTLNYTGFATMNSKHMLSMQSLMGRTEMSFIDILNHCKMHWEALMNKEGLI
tara:strand:+ start:108 stop:323 length:216 start_codon:yes stop_codon:yes gene_type:complete